MIQRVQSIYLGLCILCLLALLFDIQFIGLSNTEFYYSITGLRIETFDLNTSQAISSRFHFGGIALLGLILSAVYTLLSYKNLKKQFRLGRSLFFTYLLVLVSVMLWIYFGKSTVASDLSQREMGLGFVLFVVGFPFTFLANIGIKRDKALLDSLDRLR